MDELDIYYKKHESDSLFKHIFKKIGDDGNIPLLMRIVKINPDFNIKIFDVSYFNPLLMKHYSFEFLVKAMGLIPIKLLESGTRDEEVKEKIIYLSDYIYFSSITIDLFYCDEFTIDFFKNILEIFDCFEQLCLLKLLRIKTDYMVPFVKQVLEKDYTIFNLKFIITHFEEQYINSTVLINNINILLSPSFTTFLKTIKSSFFSSDMRLIELFDTFKKYENFFFSTSIVEHSEAITNFLRDPNRDKYNILSPLEIENFEQIRYNYHLNNNSDNNEITRSYLNITFDELTKKINNYLNKIKKFLNTQEIELLTSILNADNLLDIISNNISTLANIENRFREICKKDFANNLFTVRTNEPVINISRTFFNILAHRIRTNSTNKLALKLINDITEWDKNFIKDGYISTSLIDQYFLGLIEGGNYLLGFTNITPEDIIDMGYIDIYSSIYLYRNKIPNNRSTFDFMEAFKNFYLSGYNEVTLRRFREHMAIKPDMVIALDSTNEFSRNASSYFKVPIMLIDSFQSASFMNDHNQELLIQERIADYAKYLFKMYVSFSHNYDIVAKYFNADAINNTVNELIKRYRENCNPKLKEAILLLIHVLERININNHNLEYPLNPIETEEFRRKLII